MKTEKTPVDVPIRVEVLSVAEERYQFHLPANAGELGVTLGPGNALTFKNVKKGCHGFRLFYELDGAPGYYFPEETSDALYVEQGSGEYCPQSRSAWGQFKPHDVISGNSGPKRVLVVHNKNDTAQNFAYTLRATNGSKWLTLDPPGSNQNGDSGFIEPGTNTGVILGAVAAVAVLAVAFIALR